VAFPGQGVGIGYLGWARVAEQAAEDVGEEVGQQGGFLELVGAAGGDEIGPVLEFGLPGARLLRRVERPHLLAQHFRVEERFGFDSHLPPDRIRRRRQETKGNEHPTSNIEHPTSNDGSRFGAQQGQEGASDKLA
jgi:hypothetical protein